MKHPSQALHAYPARDLRPVRESLDEEVERALSPLTRLCGPVGEGQAPDPRRGPPGDPPDPARRAGTTPDRRAPGRRSAPWPAPAAHLEIIPGVSAREDVAGAIEAELRRARDAARPADPPAEAQAVVMAPGAPGRLSRRRISDFMAGLALAVVLLLVVPAASRLSYIGAVPAPLPASASPPTGPAEIAAPPSPAAGAVVMPPAALLPACAPAAPGRVASVTVPRALLSAGDSAPVPEAPPELVSAAPAPASDPTRGGAPLTGPLLPPED